MFVFCYVVIESIYYFKLTNWLLFLFGMFFLYDYSNSYLSHISHYFLFNNKWCDNRKIILIILINISHSTFVYLYYFKNNLILAHTKIYIFWTHRKVTVTIRLRWKTEFKKSYFLSMYKQLLTVAYKIL